MASTQRDNIIATCLLTTVLLILLIQAVSSQSASDPNTESYTYTTTQLTYTCTTLSYRTCNWYWYRWWYWYPYYRYNWYCNNYWYGYYGCGYGEYCYNNYYNDCHYISSTYFATAYRCISGWQGSHCNIPTCSPACINGLTCTAPNTCKCQSNQCGLQACSSAINCYPGTCTDAARLTCQCPLQFSGYNCQSFSLQPEISTCSASVYIKGVATPIQAYCAGVGQSVFTVWVPGNLQHIEIDWQANYVNPVALPSSQYAPYIASEQLGVAQAQYVISLDPAQPQLCSSQMPPSPSTPLNIAQCTNQYIDQGTLRNLQHNDTITINVSASNGGIKTGNQNNNGGSFSSQTFTGAPTTRIVQFQIDLRPPTHCLLSTNPNKNCTSFPIYLDTDMRTNPKIQPIFPGWTDDGSGIASYQIQVFYMQTDTSQLLANIGSPLITDVINPNQQFSYTVNQPGMYSIELTVSDRANNTAMARKLFFYNNGASVTLGTQPFFMANTVTNSLNQQWINKMDTRQNGAPYHFLLSWSGSFMIDPRYSNTWFKGVEPWQTDSNKVDDNYGCQYGMRSTDPIMNITGITSYSLTWVIDHQGGRGVQEPNTSIALSPTTSTWLLSIPQAELHDGDTIVVWLVANDVTGGAGVKANNLMVHFNLLQANITGQSFTVATDFSSLNLVVTDLASGISNISYIIYDTTLQTVIRSGISPATTRTAPIRSKRGIDEPCIPSDSSCYCVPTGECYAVTQVIQIDNCWIDQLSGHNVAIRYNVTNGAGLNSPSTIDITSYVAKVVCRNTGLSGGATAGIVIACIIGAILIILFIILIVVMILNVRRGKKAVPERFRTIGVNIRNRFSHQFTGPGQVNNNVIYGMQNRGTVLPGQDMKVENEKFSSSTPAGMNGAYGPAHINAGFLGKEDFDRGNVPRKNVQMGEILAEGRFAVVRKAFVTHGNERTPVAAKALRNGYSKADEELMSSKIVFLRGVPPHQNVVKLIGAIDDGSGEGPIMLLELCDMTLKDWLAQVKKVTSEHLENMLNFCLNIARGVEHLHSKQIIHRRLAMRNVLLKQTVSGLVAKLIGFGPTKDDAEEKTTGAGAVVPLKWMAPETLESLNKQKHYYDKKTDAWSFGVTMWEIYSLGATPYPDKKATEVKDLLKTGFRMSRPDESPPDMFNMVMYPCWLQSPKKRPDFSKICRDIETFRKGNDLEGSNYYAADDASTSSPMYGNQQYDELYDDGR